MRLSSPDINTLLLACAERITQFAHPSGSTVNMEPMELLKKIFNPEPFDPKKYFSGNKLEAIVKFIEKVATAVRYRNPSANEPIAIAAANEYQSIITHTELKELTEAIQAVCLIINAFLCRHPGYRAAHGEFDLYKLCIDISSAFPRNKRTLATSTIEDLNNFTQQSGGVEKQLQDPINYDEIKNGDPDTFVTATGYWINRDSAESLRKYALNDPEKWKVDEIPLCSMDIQAIENRLNPANTGVESHDALPTSVAIDRERVVLGAALYTPPAAAPQSAQTTCTPGQPYAMPFNELFAQEGAPPKSLSLLDLIQQFENAVKTSKNTTNPHFRNAIDVLKLYATNPTLFSQDDVNILREHLKNLETRYASNVGAAFTALKQAFDEKLNATSAAKAAQIPASTTTMCVAAAAAAPSTSVDRAAEREIVQFYFERHPPTSGSFWQNEAIRNDALLITLILHAQGANATTAPLLRFGGHTFFNRTADTGKTTYDVLKETYGIDVKHKDFMALSQDEQTTRLYNALHRAMSQQRPRR